MKNPFAGSGNILQYLPENSVGLDLAPEGDGIIQQDFFEYDPGYHPLMNNIKIATIGNPPFGSGYMNPLAKGFFNHAAKFSDLIAFITSDLPPTFGAPIFETYLDQSILSKISLT